MRAGMPNGVPTEEGVHGRKAVHGDDARQGQDDAGPQVP